MDFFTPPRQLMATWVDCKQNFFRKTHPSFECAVVYKKTAYSKARKTWLRPGTSSDRRSLELRKVDKKMGG